MEPAVISDLGGQLFVRNVELDQNKRLLADDRPQAFLNLPFPEALAYWIKNGGSEDGLKQVLKAYRRDATTATPMMLEHISRSVVARLQYALEEGDTLRDFARGVRDDTVLLGISPMSSHYLENVYRTNIQTAYGAGRFRQLTDPGVQSLRPWVQYRTAGDSRVRDAHRALDGLIFRADSDEWHKVAPPNGYQCRCSVVSLDDDDVHDEIARGARYASGVKNLAELMADAPDEASFAGPPTTPL